MQPISLKKVSTETSIGTGLAINIPGLTGAVFTLNGATVSGQDVWSADDSWSVMLTSNGDGVFKVTEASDTLPAGMIATDGAASLTLPVGNYLLTETHAPDGYNTLEYPVRVEVTSNDVIYKAYFGGQGDNYRWSHIKDGKGKTVQDVDATHTTKDINLLIPNSPGVKLPSTGGAGTIPYTILGSALVLLAIALFLKIVITKVITGSTTPLEGAVFQITGTTLNKVIIEGEVFTVDDNANPAYYKLKDGSYTTTESTAATADLYVAGLQKYKKEAKKTISAEPGQTVIYEGVSDSTGKVSFTGLPAGDYVITEIAAPAGYNKIEGTINVHIDWTKPTKADNPGIDDVTDTCTWEYTTTGHLKNAKAEATDGIIKYTVENSAGATLPSTGGIGTTIFYVAGSILVLAAAILLITKRRMGAND